jgi:hypothetical protein
MANDEVHWDAVSRSNFEAAAFSSFQWMAKARSLFEAAKKLEPNIDRVWQSYELRSAKLVTPLEPDHFTGAYFMLVAFAVENLLKAAAISKKFVAYRDNFRAKLKFPRELQSHDLLRLAEFVGLGLGKGEEDLLRRLTRSAVWFGRYPVPLGYPDIDGRTQFRDRKEYSLSWFGRTDVERLNVLVEGLPARLGLSEEYWRNRDNAA